MENIQRERNATSGGARRPDSLGKFDKMVAPLPVSVRLVQLGLLDSLRDAFGLHGGDVDFVAAGSELVGRLCVPWRIARAATGVHGGGDSILAEQVLSGEKPKGRVAPPPGTPPLFTSQGETEEVQRVAVVSYNALMRGLIEVVGAMAPIRLCSISISVERTDVLHVLLRMLSRLLQTAQGGKAAATGTTPLFGTILQSARLVMGDIAGARVRDPLMWVGPSASAPAVAADRIALGCESRRTAAQAALHSALSRGLSRRRRRSLR